MRIKEFRIYRYGPLKDTGTFEMDNFNILWGKNEKGKTLIIDALLKMLIKRPSSYFEKIDRIDEAPEGYIKLEYRGDEYKLPEDGYLSEDIPVDDFRNVFVIRDSDLLLTMEDSYYNNVTQRLTGSKTYEIEEIIEKLKEIGRLTDSGRFRNRAADCNLKSKLDKATSLINNIKELINELEESGFDDLQIDLIKKERELEKIDISLEKLQQASKREKFEKAYALLNDLKALISKLEEYERYNEKDLSEWNSLETNLKNRNIELEKEQKKSQEYEKEYETLKENLENLKEDVKKLKGQKELALTLKERIRDKNELKKQYASCEKDRKRYLEDVKEKKERLEEIEKKRAYINNKNIKAKIEELKNTTFKSGKQKSAKKTLNTVMVFSFIVGILGMAGGMVSGSILAIAGGLAFAAIGVLLGYLQHKAIISESMVNTWENLIRELKPVFLGEKLTKDNVEYYMSALESEYSTAKTEYEMAKTRYDEKVKSCKEIEEKLKDNEIKIKEIVGKLDLEIKEDVNLYLSDITAIEEDYNILNTECGKVEGNLSRLDNNIKSAKKNIGKIKNEIKEIESRMNKLKNKYGFEKPDELREKIEKKQEIQNKLSKVRESLRTLLSYQNENLMDEMDEWEKEVQDLERFKDAAKDVTYDSKREEQLSKKRGELSMEIEKIKEQIKDVEREFDNIERNARDVLRCNEPEIILSPLDSDEDLRCENFSDLEKIKELLEKFVSNNNKRKNLIKKAIDIFEDIRREEEKKTEELFGENSSAIEYFKRITDGLYVNIQYDTIDQKIKVTRYDGKVLDVDQLSGGALDQLYFAIRLSLAEKLLGERGFFILDDPFIKSDPDRLEKLFKILKELSDKGWQIIYFSSKGEIKDLCEGEYREIVKYNIINYL